MAACSSIKVCSPSPWSSFMSFLVSRLRRASVLRWYVSRSQDLFLPTLLSGHFQSYNYILLFNTIFQKPSRALFSSAWNWISSLFNYRSLRLHGIRFRENLPNVLNNPALKTFRPGLSSSFSVHCDMAVQRYKTEKSHQQVYNFRARVGHKCVKTQEVLKRSLSIDRQK